MSQGLSTPEAEQIADASGEVINPTKEDGKILTEIEFLKLILIEARVQNTLLNIGLNTKENLDALRKDESEILNVQNITN